MRRLPIKCPQLHSAARAGDIAAMMQCYAEGHDLDEKEYGSEHTPLHWAIREEQYTAAKWLINNGADVNSHDEEGAGETPLALAVQGNGPAFVQLLMTHGADPYIKGWMGLTAMDRARNRKDDTGVEMLQILFSYKRSHQIKPR